MRLKKGVRRFLIFILIVLIGVGLYFYLRVDTKSVKKVKVLKTISGYGYKLKDTKSETYKKLFNSLSKTLKEKPVDEKKYVKTISKMFIVDFYSLSDKLAKTDVGGSEFVHSKALPDFLENAEDTMYKYVESNLYGGRKQKLPTVDEVVVESVEVEPFIYGDETDSDAYIVKVKWTYTDTSTSSGYQTDATLTFVHEDKKLSLVELQ